MRYRSHLRSHESGRLYANGLKGRSCSGTEVLGVEVGVVLPHGPADTGELVGERDGGFVVTDALLEL